MYRAVISGSSLTNVQTFFNGTYGRLRTVEPAPDGGLWLTTTTTGDKDSIAEQQQRADLPRHARRVAATARLGGRGALVPGTRARRRSSGDRR